MGYTKTFMLMAGLTAIFGVVGNSFGGVNGMIMALAFACIMNFFAYFFSDKLVLKRYKAQPCTDRKILDMVAKLAGNADMPVPKTYIVQNDQPNAFATGRNPKHGAVAVTTGLMQILTENELAGVIAHELAHIKNRDTLIMTVTSTIAGALSAIGNFARMGMGRRGANGGRGRGGGLLAIIFAPLAASLVQMAISRTREYAADKAGAQICGDPLALASALEKISGYASRIRNMTAENHPSTAHLFISNPLAARWKRDNLFSTHPHTANRIDQLEKIAKYMGTTAKQPEYWQGPWVR